VLIDGEQVEIGGELVVLDGVESDHVFTEERQTRPIVRFICKTRESQRMRDSQSKTEEERSEEEEEGKQ
jgi:hypothetical protein